MLRLPVASLACLLLLVLGCGNPHPDGPAPKTQRINGKLLKKNGQPFTGGGSIQFNVVGASRSSFSVSGEIADDGSFTLNTISGSRTRTPGVPEGEYEVTVVPKSADQNTQPINLRSKYTIKTGDTELSVKMDN